MFTIVGNILQFVYHVNNSNTVCFHKFQNISYQNSKCILLSSHFMSNFVKSKENVFKIRKKWRCSGVDPGRSRPRSSPTRRPRRCPRAGPSGLGRFVFRITGPEESRSTLYRGLSLIYFWKENLENIICSIFRYLQVLHMLHRSKLKMLCKSPWVREDLYNMY